jgi:hypothetical protein
MAAIDQTMVSNILNSTLPTGTSGVPGTWSALTNAAMTIRLTSTLSTASAAGTTLTGTGYSDYSMTTASTASSSGSSVTLPAVSGGTSWTNGSGGNWTIQSIEVQSSTHARAWWGPFTGNPITVANGNTFAIAQNAVTVALA